MWIYEYTEKTLVNVQKQVSNRNNSGNDTARN